MASNLTGDFDVVAEFAVPAANRVLASMHRNQRFPHSLTLRVDDVLPTGLNEIGPAVVSSVDMLGDATVDQNRVGKPIPVSGLALAANPAYAALDPVVNANAGATIGPIVPSKLQGVAQLQLSPPTLAVTDSSGTNVTVQLEMMSRYFPDPHTSPLAEFIRGQLQVTAAVNQVASQAANVIDIDVKADSVGINFTPQWSSQPLSASDVAAVNQVVRNALKTSLLPSNTTLPSSIEYMQFKTLLGAQSGIGVLLNLQGARGNPSSFNDLFLGSGDDFAIGVGRNLLLAAFNPVITQIMSTPVPPVPISIDAWVHTFHFTYSVTLTGVSVDLAAGKIVLTIKGHAHTGSTLAPDFDFTVTQNFHLQPAGDTVELIVDDMSIDTSSWVVNLFRGAATAGLETVRDNAINNSGVKSTVSTMLSANANLGGFLSSLLSPPPVRRSIFHPRGYTLAYTAVDIQPSGIILHGTLAVTDWPAVDVEFEKIPPNTSAGVGGIAGGGVIASGPDYSALNSWIPGGTIQRFDWSMQGQSQPFFTDSNKFVYQHPPLEEAAAFAASSAGTIPGYVPLCLTVRGSRLSSSGTVAAQAVSGTACGYAWHPIINGLSGLGAAADASSTMVALAQRGPSGLVQVTGYMAAGVDRTGKSTPNLIVHFAGDSTIGRLNVLTQALQESNRADAATAVLAILSADQLAKASYTDGVVYAEDTRGAWERIFGVTSAQRPVTLIVNPMGKVVWQQGDMDGLALAEALRKVLVKGKPLSVSLLKLTPGVGRTSPNFLLELAPGRDLTLRKLAGRPVILSFWRSSLPASMQAVHDLQKAAAGNGRHAPVLLAINDGDSADVAARSFAQNGLPGILVTDPKRDISAAYGVTLWPTTVFLDAAGLVRGIRYGRMAEQVAEKTGK